MVVHPQAQALLDEWAASPTTSLETLTAEAVRADDAGVQALSGEPAAVFSVQDRRLPGDLSHIRVRVYKPLDQDNLPLLIYYHGGGFVIGPESYDIPLRLLSTTSGCVIANVTCRLAPEHQHPAAVNDALAAYEWLAENARQVGADPTRVAIGGDSSGGNLAAVVAQNTRETGNNPAFQLFIYPMLDATASTPSYETFASGFGFGKEKALWYFRQYLPDGVDRRSPTVSPYWQKDLAGLPPAFIASAGCDPLRDEAEAYAERLELAGVPVTLKRYEGMIHGFFQMAGVLDGGRKLHRDIGAFVQKAFGR